MQTETWPDAAAPRATPSILRLVEDACERGRGPDYPRCAWLAFLKTRGLEELQAPPGGRAYRWFWDNVDTGGGFVQLIIAADGHGTLVSSIKSVATPLDAQKFAAFEAALAATDFATEPSDNGSSGLDACQDQLLEVVMDRRYHFVRRACSIAQPISDSVRLLEHVAGFTDPAPDPDGCGYWVCAPKPPKHRKHH
ncbi:MAG TPA: hypothetical protein VHZ78_06875 [Rhizomicrobium sp.]|nr:hypothetical protein [Rhizomicrobium sp.]